MLIVTRQIRLIDNDILLETRHMETVPGIGEKIMIWGKAYRTTKPPSGVMASDVAVYVKKISET